MRIFSIITVIIALYIGWEAFFNHGSWKYKLTLIVETPEGLVVGSAVRKVSAQRDPVILQWLPSLVYGHAAVKGEAVVVDLGQRGVLFALLKGSGGIKGDALYMVFNEFPYEGALTSSGIMHYRSLEAKKELTFDNLPMMVRFRDINNPKSVELVDPNDLEKSFGKGVKLVSATLEMTDEKVTSGNIERLLGWFSKWEEHGGNIIDKEYFEPNLPPYPPESFLLSSDFKQG